MNLFPLNKYLLANKLDLPLQTLTFFSTSLERQGLENKESLGEAKYATLYKKVVIKKGRKIRVVWKVSPALKQLHLKIQELLENITKCLGQSSPNQLLP